MLAALRYVGGAHGIQVNSEGVIGGLPLEKGRLTPELFSRAAQRCGLSSRIVRRKLGKIHGATLPVVLLGHGKEAIVLTRRLDKERVEVVAPGDSPLARTVSLKDLEKHYTGYAILVKRNRAFERRSSLSGETSRGHWFWGTLWGFRSFYARVAIATVMINLLGLASSLFVMNVYDRVVPNQATETLFVLAIGVALAYSFEFLLKSLRTFFVDRAGHRIDLLLGGDLFERILGMSFGSRPESAGVLASQARSYESLREFFTSATIAALVDLPFIFFFAGIIYLLGGAPVALPVLIGIGFVLMIGLALQWPIGRAVNESYRAGNERQALFVESIQALETIKMTRSESELQARMEDSVKISSRSEARARGYSQLALNLTAFFQYLVTGGIVIGAYFQVLDEKMTMGAMIACVILAGRAMAPLALLASLLTRLQQSRRSLKTMEELMHLPLERSGEETRYLAPGRFEASIQARDLGFQYGEEGPEILSDLDLVIRPGERVAILGRVGSGKSTLLRLLVALNTPTQGGIVTSGVEIRQFDPAELRRHIGYVPQDPTLLYGTLRSNLKAGCPGVSDEALLKAIQRAGLSRFLRSLPGGVDEAVAEGGRSLSGGQRQSIAIARALVEEPELLVLDEPTSAMDPSTESALLKELGAYLNERPGRTLVIATHKRSVLKLVDRIVVIEKGRIVADGPRDAVLKKKSQSTPSTNRQPSKVELSAETEARLKSVAMPPSDGIGLPN